MLEVRENGVPDHEDAAKKRYSYQRYEDISIYSNTKQVIATAAEDDMSKLHR